MRVWKEKIAILTVILCSFAILCTAKIEKFSKGQNFLVNVSHYTRILFYNTSMVHAQCDQNDTWIQNNCTFHLIDFGLEGAINRTTCNVTLEADLNERMMQSDRIKLMPFGQNKTLIRWIAFDLRDANRFFKTATLDFNDCSVFHSSFDSNRRNNMPHWITYENDTYELFIWDRDSDPPNFGFLSLIYDFEGEFIIGPKQGVSDMRDDVHFLRMIALPPGKYELEYLLIEQHCQSMNDDEKIAVVSLFGSNGMLFVLF